MFYTVSAFSDCYTPNTQQVKEHIMFALENPRIFLLLHYCTLLFYNQV